MTEHFANHYATTLTAFLDDDATTCTVRSVTGVPSVPFRAIIGRKGAYPEEVVIVTNVTGTTLAITRAAEAYGGVQTAWRHPVSATLTASLTAAGIAAIVPVGVAISALPAVTVPAATDEFPVNQGGTSKKITLSQVAGYTKNHYVGPMDPRYLPGNFIANPIADFVMLDSFYVDAAVTISNATIQIGDVTDGNVNVGIYSGEVGALARVGLSGSTAAGLAWAIQTIPFSAPIALVPGTRYWFAFVSSSASCKFRASGQFVDAAFSNLSHAELDKFALPPTLTGPATGWHWGVWVALT